MAEEHIYRKFDEDLEDIRANVIQMGAIIEEQIRNAIQSLEQIDPQLAQKVINRDEDVNDLETLIEEECSLFIAKRAPQAKDLRNVLMMLRMSNDLERMGDESSKIAEATIRINETSRITKPKIKSIKKIADLVLVMLKKSLDAFGRLDTTEVVEILEEDKEVDEEYHSHMRELLTFMMEDPRTISNSLELIFVSKALERIGDHIKNISQAIVYTVKGRNVAHASIKEIKRTIN
ncbi:MAG: phosphate signaling complex protein PhoU [Proteobacteria bacterium]|jgi:phosphate transport system protein|nr:phosphate signaling complex protein PhoU [Pseudomonadota bacterium]MDA0873193.1 phosphate signaling complex protein PhoU [Pseudomonadota bacterium]MDA1134454.1 phosphate signaling complex protein PhoU [Pseudomonadota bacterium]